MTDTETIEREGAIDAQSEVVNHQDAEQAKQQNLPAAVEPQQELQQRVTLLRTFVDLAARIAGTEFVPKGLRGKPAAVLACILTGQEMGIGPMQSLSHIHIVDGKPTQSAELMRAQIMRAGHRFSVREKTNDKVTVFGQRSDTGEELTITWTLEDAKRAKLVKADSAWTSYPRAMLMARATSELARDLFADVLGGVSYTPEELGAEVLVTEGGYIDVVSSEQAPGGLAGTGDPAEAWDRVNGLKPREVVEELKRRGLPVGGKEADLRAALAEALQSTSEPAEQTDTAPVEPQERPEPEGAPPAANETSEAHTDPQGATSEPPAPSEPAEQRASASSAKAKATKRVAAAVTEMSDEQVTAMVAAYDREPIEDLAGRRGQLIGLMLDEELAANG